MSYQYETQPEKSYPWYSSNNATTVFEAAYSWSTTCFKPRISAIA